MAETVRSRSDGKSLLGAALGPPETLAVLFGAGVSVKAPAGLPTADQLLRGYWDRVARIAQKVPALVPLVPDLATLVRGVRFEEVVSVLEGMDLGRQALVPLSAPAIPNENHRLLAELGRRGCVLLTTNVDVLVEQAALAQRSRLHQVVDDDDPAWATPQSRPTIFKLHGSFSKMTGNGWSDSFETVCATMRLLGLERHRFKSNSAKKMLLARVVDQRTLLVVGYSGRDEFDIGPVVFSAKHGRPGQLIWVQHVASTDIEVSDSVRDLPPGVARLIAPGVLASASSGRVLFVWGDTTAVLRHVAGAAAGEVDGICADDLAPARGAPLDSLTSVSDAAFFVGMLDKRLGRTAQAARAFSLAVELTSQAGPGRVHAAQSLHELASALLDNGQYDDAEKVAGCALVQDRELGRPDWESSTWVLLGNIKRRTRGHEALSCYQRSLEIAAHEQYPYGVALALMKIGTILWRRAELDEAVQVLKRAGEIFEAKGFLSEFVGATVELAIAFFEGGRYDLAREEIERADEIARLLGESETRLSIEHELGMLESRLRNYDQASAAFTRAIDLGEVLGRTRDVALSRYELGWVSFRTGDLSSAEHHERLSTQALLHGGEQYFYAHNLQLQAALLLSRRDYAPAREVLRQAIDISIECGDAIHIRKCEQWLRLIDHLEAEQISLNAAVLAGVEATGFP